MLYAISIFLKVSVIVFVIECRCRQSKVVMMSCVVSV